LTEADEDLLDFFFFCREKKKKQQTNLVTNNLNSYELVSFFPLRPRSVPRKMKLVPEVAEDVTGSSSPRSTPGGRNGVKLGIVRLGKAAGKVGTEASISVTNIIFFPPTGPRLLAASSAKK
jgi:hypothetical protein